MRHYNTSISLYINFQDCSQLYIVTLTVIFFAHYSRSILITGMKISKYGLLN